MSSRLDQFSNFLNKPYPWAIAACGLLGILLLKDGPESKSQNDTHSQAVALQSEETKAKATLVLSPNCNKTHACSFGIDGGRVYIAGHSLILEPEGESKTPKKIANPNPNPNPKSEAKAKASPVNMQTSTVKNTASSKPKRQDTEVNAPNGLTCTDWVRQTERFANSTMQKQLFESCNNSHDIEVSFNQGYNVYCLEVVKPVSATGPIKNKMYHICANSFQK